MTAPPPRTPQAVPWGSAAQTILARLGPAESRSVSVVGITGPVGAGKSLLARQLGGSLLATDDYLPDYSIVPYLERDDPRHADLPLLAAHLLDLRAGRVVEVPVWSFFTHRRESSRLLHPAPLIVVEGIHALEPAVRPHLDLAVYVDAPAGVRLRRIEDRERAGERGWTIEHVREHFRDVAEPAFAARAPACRAAADFIVINPA